MGSYRDAYIAGKLAREAVGLQLVDGLYMGLMVDGLLGLVFHILTCCHVAAGAVCFHRAMSTWHPRTLLLTCPLAQVRGSQGLSH